MHPKLYQDLCTNFYTTLSTFQQLPEFSEYYKEVAFKLKYAYNFFEQRGFKLPEPTKISKNNSESVLLRNEGNKYFKEKNYVAALEYYNKSICLATTGSEDVAIGFANRSAIYLNIGCYKLCLENIELALKGNYPEKLRPKLIKRKKDCEKLMIDNTDSQEKCEKKSNLLSCHPDEKIPIMADGLEFAKDEQYGRHIRAKRDFYPGDVIITEKTYYKCIVNNDWYKKCTNCLETNFYSLLPCHECTKAMFCSETCRQEAWNRFHQFECPIIDEITKEFNETGSQTVILAIRQTLLAFTMFDDPQELEKFVKDIDIETENAFTIDFKNLTEKEYFRAIYTCSTRENDQSINDYVRFMVVGCQIWVLLKTYTNFSKLILKTPKIEDFFLHVLLRFLCITSYNSHYIEEYRMGSFALCNLLNHSCAPNICRIWDGRQMNVVVRRVIKAGDQLFDCYQHKFQKIGLKERQEYIQEVYNFVCQCDACLNDYPLLDEMPCSSTIKKRLKEEAYNLEHCEETYVIEKFGENFVKKKFIEYRNFLKKSNKKYPSYEICATENNLMMCCEKLLVEVFHIKY